MMTFLFNVMLPTWVIFAIPGMLLFLEQRLTIFCFFTHSATAISLFPCDFDGDAAFVLHV